MNWQHLSTFDQLSATAADLVRQVLSENPRAHLCLATGSSTTGLYAELGKDPSLLCQVQITKLDEWVGLRADHPGSCEVYLQEHVVEPWQVSADRYLAFESTTRDPEAECERVRSELAKRAPFDLCILGLGVNGHLGLNEPDSALKTGPHVAHLALTSQYHSMLGEEDSPPTQGMTLGIGDILASRKVLLLVAGTGKTVVFRRLKTPEVTTELPASFLHLHADVTCLDCLP